MKKLFISLILIIFFIDEYPISASVTKEFCESISVPIKCDRTSKYRQINGRCNNLINPYLGAANTRLSRLLRSRYSDNISAPPKSVTGAELPNARLISLNVFGDTNIPSTDFSQAFVHFSQFIIHDLVNVLSAPSKKGCCRENGLPVPNPDPSCLYIPVPKSDNIHSGWKCLDFTRSLTDNDIKCPNYPSGYPAEQINGATASLDLSQIYGTSIEQLNKLRSFKNGLLLVETRFNTTWPLQDPRASDTCFIQAPKETCYFSGDARINQNPELSIIQILFIREHNRIAKKLQKLNPHWLDEIVFQEARRINIAQYQYIVFYQWQTSVLDAKILKKFGLFFQNSGGDYANDYDPSIDSSIYNEFTAAMFRSFHSIVDGHLRRVSESQSLEEIVRLSETYYRPKFIEGYGKFESFIRGMVAQPSQKLDKNYDAELRSYLFKRKRIYGSDLKSLDIQRGRDHGLGSYNDFRTFCGLPRAKKWEDFLDNIEQSDITKLKKVYASVDDVDLHVGGTVEKPYAPGFFIGHLCLCMLQTQFKAIRSGDRYWFENGDPAIRFTPTQLTEIRKSSLSRIICDNSETILRIPKNVFLLPDDTKNNYVKCSDVQSVNLSVFKE